MELRVQGSSSKGNSYIIGDENEALIIECGCPVPDVLKDLDFNTKKVVGCLISHEHKDHSKNAEKLQTYGIKIYASEGTASEVKGLRFPAEIIKAGELVKIGNFKVLPFDTHHDCKEPLGFLIAHPKIGMTLFAIDTSYLSHTFDGLTNILIEANYSDDILQKNIDDGKIHSIVRNHVKKGHMSLQTCIEALQANDLTKVSSIVLLHLSNDNGDPDRFRSEVEKATGKPVFVSTKGLKIKLGNTPF